jgi:hypothetical protein
MGTMNDCRAVVVQTKDKDKALRFSCLNADIVMHSVVVQRCKEPIFAKNCLIERTLSTPFGLKLTISTNMQCGTVK